ncbi:protein FAR1-RELATED SEQUENCE 5-like [Silene latifolia]|uniref:protein FAR1-RELATED SEQUENCE 5-like n=1 Tax=Silene latifolia TaxID=37657 RepID=UPI003D76AB65
MIGFLLILHNYHIIPIISFVRALYFCASLKFGTFLFDFRFSAQISAYSILIVMSAFNHMFVILLILQVMSLLLPVMIFISTPHVEQHSVPSRVHQLLLDSTPGGSELWTRNVALEFKPYIGQLFGTLAEAISFYDVYAEACGFEPRKSSQKGSDLGDVKYKYVVCNREGFRDRKRKAIVLDSGKEQATPRPFDIRNTKLTRIGCTAMIEFRYNGDGYVVFQFREWHNHRLCSLRNQQFQKKHRHLHLYHKKTIIDHSRVNQGPTRAFRNVKEYVDSYENVGAQLVDFKNFGRDIKCFIGDRDAQLFVNYFEDKRDTSEGFYFAYEVDSGKCLTTTKGRVTFCFALLFHEDEDSFTWVFQKFLDAMGQREPHCIITDQCAGIKLGLRAVFKHAKRRYCMWHIMQKVTDKVGPAISRETDFVSCLNAIVWDAELEPLEFEEKWCQLVNEHNLDGNSWLSTMFRKRRKWIPAYFRDVPMGCLLRTTQRSESQNNFFKRFENAHGTLVEFLMRFQSAIDVQRHTQKQLDRDDDCTLPQLATSLKLEAHASKVYTNAAFSDFQVEASASICSLSVGGFTPPANGVELIGIADADHEKTYQVVYNSLTNDAECSCKLFNRKGIICRHIIWVYSGKQVHTLPDKYILMRWTKNAHKIPLYGPLGKLIEDFDATDLRKMEMCKLWSSSTQPSKQYHILLEIISHFCSTQYHCLRVTDCDIGSSDEDDDADDG